MASLVHVPQTRHRRRKAFVLKTHAQQAQTHGVSFLSYTHTKTLQNACENNSRLNVYWYAHWLVAPAIVYVAEPYFSATVARLDPDSSAMAYHAAMIAGLARNLYLIPNITVKPPA